MKLDHPLVAWSVAVAPLVAFDAWLIRRGMPSLSEHAANHPQVMLALTGYLTLHFLNRAKRGPDPLVLLARRLRGSHVVL